MKYVTAVFFILYAFCEFQLASDAISISVPTRAPPASSSGTIRKPGLRAPGSSPGSRGSQNTNQNLLLRGPVGAPGSPNSRGPQCPRERQRLAQLAQQRADKILQEINSSDESCVSIHPPPPGSQRYYLAPGGLTLL